MTQLPPSSTTSPTHTSLPHPGGASGSSPAGGAACGLWIVGDPWAFRAGRALAWLLAVAVVAVYLSVR